MAKKHRKPGRGKARSHVRSHLPAQRARRRATWAIVLAAIICAAAAGGFYLWFLFGRGQGQQESDRSSNRTQDHALLPVHRPIQTAEDLAALKKAEIELAQELLRESRDSEDSLIIMGNVYNRYGNAIEAMKFWRKALAINPKRADVYMSMGWLSVKMGELEEAVGQYRKALEIQPQLPDVRSNIALALMMLNRHDEAIAALEKEIQISPNSSFAYFLRGQAYLQKKELEMAKQNYELAIKIDPEYANAYYGLATVWTKLGDSDKARECSEKFKELKAEDRVDLRGGRTQYNDLVETQKGAALTYIEVGRMYLAGGKLDKAEELLKQAAGLDPENSVPFLELASLYQKTSQPSKALQMFKKLSEIEPGNAACHLNIGILSARLKQFDNAEQAFRKAITLAPDNSNAYRELARLYVEIGKALRMAKQFAEKAVELEATAANCFVLSLVSIKNGDAAGALSAIKRAVELEPGNPEYQRMYQLIQQRN